MALYGFSGWWVAFYIAGIAVLSLLMVESMMQFTSSLLERRPVHRRASPRSFDEMRDELLELRGTHYLIESRRDASLRVRWKVLADNEVPDGARIKQTTTWSTRACLDRRRREVRWFESVRSSSSFIGFTPWLRVSFGWWYQGGYLSGSWSGVAYVLEGGIRSRIVDVIPYAIDTDVLREAFVERVTTSGWLFRPVTLPFYTSPSWLALTDRLVPDRIAVLPRRKVWGMLYPLSFVVLIGFLIAPVDDIDAGDVALILLICAAWWGTWGLIAWLLAGAPHSRWAGSARSQRIPRRRARRRSS